MRVAHLLRKCNAAEWGGTETAVQRLLEGLRAHRVNAVVYCPHIRNNGHHPDPLAEAGWTVKRFNACLPILGVPEQRKRQLIAVGGNLMSFDLLPALWREPDLDVIHTHTLGRLGAIALNVARRRGLPFVVTIHGGLLDLPTQLKSDLDQLGNGGWEWGKMFSLLLQTRRFFANADVVITCNEKEANLFSRQYPDKRVMVQAHGVPLARYQQDQRETARQAFPQLHNRDVLLAVGRLDPVKNQSWLIEHAPPLFKRFPDAALVLAGPCTDETYGQLIQQKIDHLGLADRVLLTGGMPPDDPRLIGLMQEAKALLLPSISETFGLVILEAWAAGIPVIASRTTGSCALIQHGRNGWLFSLVHPGEFHDAVSSVLQCPELSRELAAAGHELVRNHHDSVALAGRMKRLYEQLMEEKHAVRDSA
ncbi:MAG: glycosyltransferase family 4 protein [Verrucomicrobiota bacterium]